MRASEWLLKTTPYESRKGRYKPTGFHDPEYKLNTQTLYKRNVQAVRLYIKR